DIVPRLELDGLCVGLERYPDRIATSFHRFQLFAQHAPDHQDAAVALAKVFFGMNRHGAFADLRLIVARKLLVLGFRHVPPEFAVELRAHAADVAGIFDTAGDVDAERGVVDRQCPADRLDAGELRHARVRHDAQSREGGFGDAIEHTAVVLLAD